jgi:manganese/zinc/iron transport system ATP- binding protein
MMGEQAPPGTLTASADAVASESSSPALEARNLIVSYHDKPVLRHVSFRIPPGELVAVVGPNGAGKSTLLKAILGLVRLTDGEVLAFGRPVATDRLAIAYVPQTETVDWDFPVTAKEVVMMGRYGRLGYLGRPTREDRQLAEECLATVSMEEFADRHIRQLSGGQQKRVFLARALAQQSPILLLDEPMSGVDAATEQAIFELMAQFAREGKTLVVVNHNLEVLDQFASVLLLNRSVIAHGPVDRAATRENLRRTYGGHARFLDEAERQLREAPEHGH